MLVGSPSYFSNLTTTAWFHLICLTLWSLLFSKRIINQTRPITAQSPFFLAYVVKLWNILSSAIPLKIYPQIISFQISNMASGNDVCPQSVHGMCPQSVRDLFSVNSTGYNFRGADFHMPRFHSVTYEKHSSRYLGPTLWNSLPSNLRNLPSLQSFKQQIRLVNLLLKLKSDCGNCELCSNWNTNWPNCFIYLLLLFFIFLLNILVNVNNCIILYYCKYPYHFIVNYCIIL